MSDVPATHKQRKSVIESGKLKGDSTVSKMEIVAPDGKRYLTLSYSPVTSWDLLIFAEKYGAFGKSSYLCWRYKKYVVLTLNFEVLCRHVKKKKQRKEKRK